MLRRSALAGMSAQLDAAAGPGARCALVERAFTPMVSLRTEPGSVAARAVEDVVGVALPRACGEVASGRAWSALWLGPDEWLLVAQAPTEPGADPLADAGAALVEALRTATAGQPAAVVDVSANRTVLELSGDAAREVLEKGCPVDLHPRSFPEDTAVATTLARIPVQVWKVDATTFRVLPRTSYAAYVATWLLDAMQEFTPAPDVRVP